MDKKDPISGFVFDNDDKQQTFNHFWKEEGKWHDCTTCTSSIDVEEPISQHWLRKAEEQRPQLTKQQRAVLDIIEARQIETFFFCDESSKDNPQDFISETFGCSVPKLMRWMFHNGTQNVKFSLACYVNLSEQVLIFQSGTLAVHHHYDIEESVSVVSDTLNQRIKDYMDQEDYSIARIKLQVKRFKEDVESADLPLPIKLRYGTVGARFPSSCSESDLASVRDAYVKHSEFNGYFPANLRANLYGLQQCKTTKELYVVPYHISEQPIRNFLILNDIMGQFQSIHEVPTPDVNSFTYLRALQCFRCRAEFTSRSRLHIHQQLRCGEDFSVDSLLPEIVEVYDQCLPISRSDFQYSCYGIIKPKTISLGKSTVPCVFINNSDTLFI